MEMHQLLSLCVANILMGILLFSGFDCGQFLSPTLALVSLLLRVRVENMDKHREQRNTQGNERKKQNKTKKQTPT